MGSSNRYLALERFEYEFGEKIQRYFKEKWVGLKVVGMSEIEYDHYRNADIELSNGGEITAYFGWSSEEEMTGEEEGFLKRDEIASHLIGETIVDVDVGYENDDEFFILVETDSEQLNVPFGFDVDDYTLIDHGVITENEMQGFRELYNRK